MISKRFALSSLFQKPLSKKAAHHQEHELDCTSLCCAHAGQYVLVAQLVGDADESAKLRDLGVREGAVVTVVRDGDPLVVGVDDARFGIGRNAAMNVLCEIIE